MSAMHQAMLVGTSAAPFVGDLDGFTTDLLAVYSIKRKLGSWTGDCFKAIRSSDGDDMEVGFNPDGTLNTAAMLSWAGSDTVTVELWYDQTGNGRHLDQGNASYRPRLATGGVADGFVRFDGSDDYLQSLTAFGGGVTAHSVAWYGQLRNTTTSVVAELGDINTQTGWYTVSLLDGGNSRLRMGVGDAGSAVFVVWNGTTQSLTAAEAAWMATYDRSKSTASNYAAWAVAHHNGSVDPDVHVLTSGTPAVANFADQTLRVGGRSALLNAALDLKTCVVWGVNQDDAGNAAAIATAVVA
jgi:hypothetical protein